MKPIKITIAEDQNLFRQAICMLIESEPGIRLLGEVPNGKLLLELLEASTELPDILIMDMSMPEMDGLELSRALYQKFPQIRIIVLSVHASERLIAEMITSGASAYLVKNCDREELITAIKTTHETGFYMNRQTLLAIQESSRKKNKSMKTLADAPSELTPRETEILLLICQEKSSQEIAETLFLSARTVEGHRINLLLKTGSRNTAGLVLFAVRNQLLQVI
ncbi:MAG: response regulator transcription factor [Phormidesmis sp. FL-bin-119]|nr:response regulator transcription factor [Pedobacter sp.]